jgi:hypothetical protein
MWLASASEGVLVRRELAIYSGSEVAQENEDQIYAKDGG